MFEVEVDGSPVRETSGTLDNGQPWQKRVQQAYFKQPGQKYPLPFMLRLEKGQVPYPAGNYTFGQAAFEVKSGDLQLSRYIKLEPAAKPSVSGLPRTGT